jgi:hypothetical protein
VLYLASGSTKVLLKSGDDCLLSLESRAEALQLNRVSIQNQKSGELILLAIGPEFWVLTFSSLISKNNSLFYLSKRPLTERNRNRQNYWPFKTSVTLL